MIKTVAGFLLVGISLLILLMYILKGEQQVAVFLWKDKTILMFFSLVVGIILLILNRIILGATFTTLGVLIAIVKLIQKNS